MIYHLILAEASCPVVRTTPQPASVDRQAQGSEDLSATTTNHLPASAQAQDQESTTPLLEASRLQEKPPKLEFPTRSMDQSSPNDGTMRGRALSLSVQQQTSLDNNLNHIHQRRLSSAATTSYMYSANRQNSDDAVVLRRRNSAALAVTSSAIAAAAVVVAGSPKNNNDTFQNYTRSSMETVPDEDEGDGNDISDDTSSDSLLNSGPVQLILREISADSFATFL